MVLDELRSVEQPIVELRQPVARIMNFTNSNGCALFIDFYIQVGAQEAFHTLDS